MSRQYEITDDMGIYGIYVKNEQDEEELVYIGSTVSFTNRFKQHKDRTLNEHYDKQPALYGYLRQHKGRIQCKVIDRISDHKIHPNKDKISDWELHLIEYGWIRALRPRLNKAGLTCYMYEPF